MATSGDTLTAPALPEGLYENPAKLQAVSVALEAAGIANPTIYYPGSSTDVSLARIPGAHVIHVDPALQPEQMNAMTSIGLEAQAADAHTFRPDQPVDAICFFRPSGIKIEAVLDAAPLTENGIVTWVAAARPDELQQREDLELIGAVPLSEDGAPHMETEHLEDYFQLKTYDELTAEERQHFHKAVEPLITLKEGSTWADAYERLKGPRYSMMFDTATHASLFHYKNNEPALFVYHKRPTAAATTTGPIAN